MRWGLVGTIGTTEAECILTNYLQGSSVPRFVPGDDRIPISDHRSGIYSIRPARKTNEEAHFVLQKAMAQGTFLSTGTCRRNRPLRSYIARKRLRGAKNIAIASEGFGRMGAWPALCLHACKHFDAHASGIYLLAKLRVHRSVCMEMKY